MDDDPKFCADGHTITSQDEERSGGWLLPCGCPIASPDARRDAGMPTGDEWLSAYLEDYGSAPAWS